MPKEEAAGAGTIARIGPGPGPFEDNRIVFSARVLRYKLPWSDDPAKLKVNWLLLEFRIFYS
jgi:hypothetical protein